HMLYLMFILFLIFFFSSRRRHTRSKRDWSSDVCSSDLSLGLVKGDKVAVMMPNILQYPIVMLGIIRAGMILVNVNPLYTSRELRSEERRVGKESGYRW